MENKLFSREFLLRVWARADDDELLGRSAQLSYYFLLALFPLLLFLVTLFGYFNGAGSHLRHRLFAYLGEVMPATALHLVTATIDEVTQARGGGKLSAGLLLALWASSSGMNAISQSLNAAYDVRETRPWWKVRLISIMLTVALATLIVSALLIVLYGGRLGHFLAALIHLGRAFALTWKILQWPIALIFVFITFSLIYQYAPNVATRRPSQRLSLSDYRRRWLSPGVAVAVLLW